MNEPKLMQEAMNELCQLCKVDASAISKQVRAEFAEEARKARSNGKVKPSPLRGTRPRKTKPATKAKK